MKEFNIQAWPGFKNYGNPYNYILYTNIAKKGFQIYEFEFTLKEILKSLFLKKTKIFHIHWPTNILDYSTHFKARYRLVLFVVFIKLLQALNRKVVWTVHNLQAHGKKNADLQRKLYSFLYHNVDGFITMNKSGISTIRDNIKDNKRQKICYIPHPSYTGYYPNKLSREKARQKLTIEENKFVILFIGQIRTYKNVPGLIRAFKNLKNHNTYLLIAGLVHADAKDEIKSELTNTSNIKLYDNYVKDDELQVFFNASDLVVTPYSNIFNSGSVFLNLTYSKPTLGPSMGVFPELQKTVGAKLIKLFDGELSSEDLDRSISEVKNESTAAYIQDLSSFAPERIAKETIDFYRSLL